MSDRNERKTVKIPFELFVDILTYFFHMGDEPPIITEGRIIEGLTAKVQAMKAHDEYIPKSGK